MKKLLSLSLLLAGCAGQSANVLSNDGNKASYCAEVNWTNCVMELCPNGYTIVRPTGGYGTALLKCKPER